VHAACEGGPFGVEIERKKEGHRGGEEDERGTPRWKSVPSAALRREGEENNGSKKKTKKALSTCMLLFGTSRNVGKDEGKMISP